MRHKVAVIGGILVALLSLIPGDHLPKAPFTFSDVAVHFALYLIWIIAMHLEGQWQYQVPFSRSRAAGKLILVTLYGGLIEMVQEAWIPGRFGDWIDVLANGTGAFIGIIVAGLISASRKQVN